MTLRYVDPIKLLCPICYHSKFAAAKFCGECRKDIEELQNMSHTILRTCLAKHVKLVMLHNAALTEDLT